MGKKVKPHGSSIATPYVFADAPDTPKTLFCTTITTLCRGYSFSDEALDDLYEDFCALIGKWFSEWAQPELLPIVTRLDHGARFLEGLASSLGALQTGIQRADDIELATLVRQAISLNPRVGDLGRADKVLCDFSGMCSEMAQAFRVAVVTAKQDVGTAGRPKLSWYDDFTSLLLEIAKLSNIEADLGKNRETSAREGWLFEAALALEGFFYPEMRSPTFEACGKRLERSLKRLKARSGQKRF